jgi:hypothetical protein
MVMNGILKDIQIIKKKKFYSLQYKGETLALIDKGKLASVIVNNLKVDLLDQVQQEAVRKLRNSPLETKAMQLEKVYTKHKRLFHKNKKIRNYKPTDKEFKYFVKALEIVKRFECNNEDFIQSQIKGMAFINNYKGQFPKPNQLVTINAENRLLDYLQEKNGTSAKGEVERIELRDSDRKTELMENPTFVSRWDKLEAGTATLREAYYLHDCMLARNGRVTNKVKKYIKKLKEDE